jgi:hypothetical protein
MLILHAVLKALLAVVCYLIYNEDTVNRSFLVKDYFSHSGLTRLKESL